MPFPLQYDNDLCLVTQIEKLLKEKHIYEIRKKKLHNDTLKVNYFVSSHETKLNVTSVNARPCECH
jgi:hypothetical protein